jgi:hypothetical protein
MPALFDLLENEPEPGVRSALALDVRFPYPDGNSYGALLDERHSQAS